MNFISPRSPVRLRAPFYRSLVALSAAITVALLPAEAVAKPRKTETRAGKKAKPAATPKTKAAAVPAALDPVTEWELINGDAISFNNALAANPADEDAQQKLAELALRAARGAERALSRGDEDLFAAYREQIETQFRNTRGKIQQMSERRVGAADYTLALFALHGMLEPRNLERACARFATAVDKGFRGARFRLGQCLEESDPARAATLLREAADSGHVAAMEYLGRRCLDATPPDTACAYTELERAANEGRASAKTLLAWMYAKGMGDRGDEARAVKLYREAAAAGDLSARNNLGELLENGRGAKVDPKAAFDQYRQAAEAGYPPSQFNLGRLYAAGKGVDKDAAQARRWLEEAARGGVEPAGRILEILAREEAAGKAATDR